MPDISRRDFGRLAGVGGVGALASPAWSPFAVAQGAAKVVIVGGGAGGATVAHYIKKDAPELDVTLIETNPIYSSSFFSNLYLGGLRTLESLNHTYGGLGRLGVKVVHDTATDVDTSKKMVKTKGGRSYGYDRLVLSPGIDIKYDSIKGYSREAVPHHAARLHDGGAGQAPAQAAAAGHARRRHGGDGPAQQSLSLPARTLRAGLHDRALPEDQEAQVEARYPRPEEDLLQAAGDHGGVREVLQGHHRAQSEHRDRRLRGGERRSPRPRRSSPRPARR